LNVLIKYVEQTEPPEEAPNPANWLAAEDDDARGNYITCFNNRF